MKRLFLFCTVLLTLGACAPKVSYVGKYYPMTERVEVFYSKDDVGRSYETMGHAEAGPVSSNAALQKCVDKLEKDATLKGADAIIVEGIGTTASVTGWGADVMTNENRRVKATLIKYK